MSHSNGRIYTETVGGVKYGVSIGDIQAVLGTSKNDIKQLCLHSSVNMWSRYKPVPWDGALNPQGAHPNDWQKGKDGDYGISANTLHPYQVALISTIIDGAMNSWTYTRDTLMGRFLDFNGYNHNARNPFGLHTENLYDLYADNEDIRVLIDGDVISSGPYQLAFDDIKLRGYQGGSERTQLLDFKELYIGFVIYFYSTVQNYHYQEWVHYKTIILSNKIKELNPPYLYNIGQIAKPDPFASWPVDFRIYPVLFDTTTVNPDSQYPTDGYNIVPVPGWNYNAIRIVDRNSAESPTHTTFSSSVHYVTNDNLGGDDYSRNEGCLVIHVKGSSRTVFSGLVTVRLRWGRPRSNFDESPDTNYYDVVSNRQITLQPGQEITIGRDDDNLTFNVPNPQSGEYNWQIPVSAQEFMTTDNVRGRFEVYVGAYVVLTGTFDKLYH